MDTFHGQQVIFHRKEVPPALANFVHAEFCVVNNFCFGMVMKSLSENNFYFLPFLAPFYSLQHCQEWHSRGIKPNPQYSEDRDFRGYWGTLQAARQKAEQFAKSL